MKLLDSDLFYCLFEEAGNRFDSYEGSFSLLIGKSWKTTEVDEDKKVKSKERI